MTRARRPAGDLIEAVVANMRANLEVLRYTTVAPSRFAVYLSATEHARLEGLIPRLQAETIRALNEELARQNRRSRLRQTLGRLVGNRPPLEIADTHWHIDFLPDLDGDLEHDQDILVQSELVLPPAPELGSGERTRRVTTVQSEARTTSREELVSVPRAEPAALARLTFTDDRGPHSVDIARDTITIGRGGMRFPVDVRVATTDEVSREHARIRRDPLSGAFSLIDLSMHGTSVDGRRVPAGYTETDGRKQENGVETPLDRRATIALADKVVLAFEQLG
jgi:hypothetical protein